jgi:hypothetical protein
MMVVNFLQNNSIGTSLVSLVKGFILSQRSDCRSPATIKFYDGCLRRFLWWTGQNNIPDDARLLNEWQIREFLSYVSGETHRWGREGNGSESSTPRATYNTVHHYYRVLKTFFNWMVCIGLATQKAFSKHLILMGDVTGTVLYKERRKLLSRDGLQIAISQIVEKAGGTDLFLINLQEYFKRIP